MRKMEMRKTYLMSAWILIGLLSSSGCAGVIQMRGTPGDDLSAISVGDDRVKVEGVVGLPDKTCTRQSNNEQAIWYFYDEGQIPASIWSSSLIDLNYYVFVIVTLGLYDLAFASIMTYTDGLNGLIRVDYDANDHVTGYHRYSHNDLNANWGSKGFSSGILACEPA